MTTPREQEEATAKGPFAKEAVAIFAVISGVVAFLVGWKTTGEADLAALQSVIASGLFLLARWQVYSKQSVDIIKQQTLKRWGEPPA
jgi:hypothetical protein